MDIPDQAIEFVQTRAGVDASIMPIGLNSTQVVLVAEDGEWLRFVVPTMSSAKALCESLKLEHQEGYSDSQRQRMGNYRRSPEDWADAPYPERQRSSST